MSAGSWTEFFSHVSSFLTNCQRQYGIANKNFSEYAVEHLTVTIESLSNNIISVIHGSNVSTLAQMEESLNQLLQTLRHILNMWIEYCENLDVLQNRSRYTVPVSTNIGNSRRGCPPYLIRKEQLEYLRSLSFSWVDISKLLMVSRMTLYRRRVEFGIVRISNLSISDPELTLLVQRTITQHPSVGQSFMWGVVRSQGYMVTRERVRRILRTCDPINTALRWGGIATPRQPYSVPGPNSLWHIRQYYP